MGIVHPKDKKKIVTFIWIGMESRLRRYLNLEKDQEARSFLHWFWFYPKQIVVKRKFCFVIYSQEVKISNHFWMAKLWLALGSNFLLKMAILGNVLFFIVPALVLLSCGTLGGWYHSCSFGVFVWSSLIFIKHLKLLGT